MIDRRRTSTALALGLGLMAAQVAWTRSARAAENDQTVMTRPGAADHAAALQSRLPEHLRQRLSSGARNLAGLAGKMGELRRLPVPSAPMPAALAAGRISDPAGDFASRLGGFTQNETSTAWCNPNVVVGFNDSGSFLASGVTSFNGLSRSTNNGGSFTDLGFLPSGDP